MPAVSPEAKARQRQYQANWRAHNQEYIRQYQANWIARNQEHIRQYRKEHAHQIKANRRVYFADPEKSLARRQTSARWRAAHPESVARNRQRNRDWYEHNQDHVRQYKKEHAERIKALDRGRQRPPDYCRQYRREHADHINERRRELYARNPERIKMGERNRQLIGMYSPPPALREVIDLYRELKTLRKGLKS